MNPPVKLLPSVDAEMQQMFDGMSNARKEVLPSKYWVELNQKNCEQLEKSGYENFKQTLALNYFTWLGESDSVYTSPQMLYLRKHLPPASFAGNVLKAFFGPKHDKFSRKQSFDYNLRTRMLWEYAQRAGCGPLLEKLEEPADGNPPRLYLERKLISQDLANSVLEYQSILKGIDDLRIGSVMELGAGYGRNAYVFLKLIPNLKYIVVDIPPALYVSQRYLCGLFPEKKAFRYRPFADYASVREEFESADMVFLLPGQLDSLPGKIADLFVNVSSLHEMRPDQIDYYFGCVDRLIRRFFYLKAWKVSKIPYEEITVLEEDYPVRKNWKRIYREECPVQTEFFQAMFAIS